MESQKCPRCHVELSFVCSWTFRGVWGYKEVQTYECPEHGPVFVSPEASVGYLRVPRLATGTEDCDRDSLVTAPRKPTPTLNAGAIAIPEPDSPLNH